MMFAKNPEVADYFRSDWNSLTKKTYRAWVEGIVDEPSGVFESFLLEDADGYKVRSVKNGGKFATTQWKVVRRDTRRKETLVEINLKSGRKNQIRVHFSENGHPVVGDVKYGAKKASRMFLRSVSLEFRLPDGEVVCVNASSCFSGGLRHN
jgi:tRNA pseudouridine32 synthase/23S rRNA pseudouridine746 synthase/23S rRNA pseudouridine1911/1915/1917 synthase